MSSPKELAEFGRGVRIFYVWLGQTLAVVVCLLIIMSIYYGLGLELTTGLVRGVVIGAVIGFAIPTYRWRKIQQRWLKDRAALKGRLQALEAELAGRDRAAG